MKADARNLLIRRHPPTRRALVVVPQPSLFLPMADVAKGAPLPIEQDQEYVPPEPGPVKGDA